MVCGLCLWKEPGKNCSHPVDFTLSDQLCVARGGAKRKREKRHGQTATWYLPPLCTCGNGAEPMPSPHFVGKHVDRSTRVKRGE